MRKNGSRRGRRTADKMEEYRKALSSRNVTEGPESDTLNVSPASGARSTRNSGGRTMTSPQNQLQPSPISKAGKLNSRNKTGNSSPPKKGLEALAFVPESPPRYAETCGPKRVMAPRLMQDGNGHDEPTASSPYQEHSLIEGIGNECSGSDAKDVHRQSSGLQDSEETSRPSKKRRLFNHLGIRKESSRDNSCNDSPHQKPPLRSVKPRSVFEDDDMRAPLQNVPKIPNGSDGSIEENLSLELVSVSSSVIFRMLESFRKKILKEIEAGVNKQTSDMEAVSTKLQEIQGQIQDLHNIVQTSGSYSGGSNTTKLNKTALAVWEKKLDELTPHTRWVFNSHVFARILAFNVPVMVTSAATSASCGIVVTASKAFSTMMFSLQPGDSREKYKEGIGKSHSEFKFSVVCNTFFNIQKNSFGLFRVNSGPNETEGIEKTQIEDASSSRPETQSSSQIIRPAWLRPDFVKTHHIVAGQKFLEKTRQGRKDKIRDTPTSSDIAIHGAVRVYRFLGAHLHDGREKVKMAFFQDLGYLLVKWSSFSSDYQQHAVKIWWKEDDIDVETIEGSVEAIHDTSVCTSGESFTRADTLNKQLLKELFRDWPELVLLADHDVFVVGSTGTQRKHSGGSKRRIRRNINLIEVACNFCTEYTQLRSIESFLRTHKGALRCVMAFAHLFRSFAKSFIDGSNLEAEDIVNATNIKVGFCSMDQIMPGYGAKKILLDSKCLRMNEKEFEQLNQPFNQDQVQLENGEDNEDGGREIQASAMMGIAAL